MLDSNAQKNSSKNMDYMDIDQVMDVPDSPDRFAAQKNNQGVTNPPREKGKLVIGNGNFRSLSFRPHENISISDESEGHSDSITVSALGSSSSSRNGHLFRRLVGEKASKYDNKHSIHSQNKREEKALSTSQSHFCGEDKALSCRALENSQAGETIKGYLSTNGLPNSSKISSSAVKGKEKIDYASKGRLGFDNGNRSAFIGDSHPKAGNVTLNSVTSSRVSGQKRLVRNGCISPHNIAKAKHRAEKHNTLSVDAVQNDVGTVASNGPDSVDIRDLIAEENGCPGAKGKGVLIHPFSSKEPDTKTIDLSSRSSTTRNVKVNSSGDSSRDAFGCFEGFGGWRSTRNRTKKLNIPLSDEDSHPTRKDDTSQAMPQFGRVNEPRHVADALIKRQKQGSSVDNPVECSTPHFDTSGIVVRDSSGESSTSRSIRNQRRLHLDISHPVIEIDEFSPESRPRVSDNIGFSSNDDLDATVRQLEADEMLARELQEQLYNEVPGVGVGEIDAQVAFSLQNEENSHHAFSGGRHIVSRPRGSSVSNLYRQSLSRSSHNPSTRRGTQARVPTSTRMARLRSRPPSLPRVLSSGQPLFPSNMDVDMRIHILEALEAFNDMGVAGNFLQGQPDFNENDYEMLLALDENNHHVGASVHQINGLPQSTVQTDNFEEACAICLETPSIGDTIRHLPCLHKFHKDCIDQWLGRSTSCPVCKSSIT